MDSLDNFDTGDTGAPEGPSEGPKESSEKQRERSSKALAGIQKSRKDESRARKHSDVLAGILIELLKDAKYDHVVDGLLFLLKNDVPSIAVLAFSAISFDKGLRALADHLSLAVKIPVPQKRDIPVHFDEKLLSDDERSYINLWVEILFSSLTSNISVLLTKKLITQLDSPLRNEIIVAMARFFEIFLSEAGFIIETKKSEAYTRFILDEVEKRLRRTKLEEF